MSDSAVEKLYDHYSALSAAKDKVSEHAQDYLEVIKAGKGSDREKILAIRIISQFFKNFPDLQDSAIDAITDLCEDDDPKIRINTMKCLPTLCKDSKNSVVIKVADLLAQLLQLEDSQEYSIASNALVEVLQLHAVTVLKHIFAILQEEKTGPNICRRCIKFLITKVKTLEKSVLTTEVEDIIITETKKVLSKDPSAEVFISMMPFLIATRMSHTFPGQQELINLAAEQAELNEEFDPLDKKSNNVDKLVTCIKFVLPLFSAKVESTKFVTYICDQVLPQWDKIAVLENGNLYQLTILRQLAELSTHCGKLDNASLYVVQIYQKLKDYMPPPPEDTDVIAMPLLDFTVVECLLYAFHKLARQCPDFLTHDPQVLKDFRARLMYFSRGAQGCSKALSNLDLKDKSLTEEETKKKNLSPKLLSNINTLIKDLFYQPPKYQCNVQLSFKIEESALKKVQEKPTATVTKRHVPITFDANGANAASNKQSRTNKSSDSVKLYTPPSGKFSNSFQNYGGRGRGRSGRGGGGRGRNTARSWRN